MKYILKSTCRNFVRKPITNLINLLGLAVSLALVIILSVYCYSELTTDHFQKNSNQMYLCTSSNDRIHTSLLLKEQIDLNVPGVESTVRVGGAVGTPVFQADDNDPIPSDMIFADSGFFNFFTYKTISGNPESALKEPMSLVITKLLAKKLFGERKSYWKNCKI